jgi:hypothetical protein
MFLGFKPKSHPVEDFVRYSNARSFIRLIYRRMFNILPASAAAGVNSDPTKRFSAPTVRCVSPSLPSADNRNCFVPQGWCSWTRAVTKQLLLPLLACFPAFTQGLYLNVKNPPYNAHGDGSTDDTAAIQQALNDAYSAGGGTVYIPCGTYALASPKADTLTHLGHYYLLVQTGVQLQGQSEDCAILKPTNYQGLLRISTLVFGSVNWNGQIYQDPEYIDGQRYYPLNATSQGSTTVTLSDSQDASNFHAGDYIALFLITAQTTTVNPMANIPSGKTDTITFASSAGFPATFPFWVLVGYNEMLEITGLVNGTTYNCVRAWAGSVAGSHPAGSVIQSWTNLIEPGEFSKVVSSSAGGALTLQFALARSFPNAIIGNVTHGTNHDIGVSDLTWYCQYCITISNVFGFSAERVRAIEDSSSTSPLNMFNSNQNRGIDIEDSEFLASGSNWACCADIAASNTQDVVFANNVVQVQSFTVGEFPAHFTFEGNQVTLNVTNTGFQSTPFQIEGTDMLVSGNTITIQFPDAAAAGVTDFNSTAANAQWMGLQTRFINNDITCIGTKGACVYLRGKDTVLAGGSVNAGGQGLPGVQVSDSGQSEQNVTICNVNFDGLAGSFGIVLTQTTSGMDGITFTGNTLAGSSTNAIKIYNPDSNTPNGGGYYLYGNTFSGGFGKQLAWTPAYHPNISLNAPLNPTAVLNQLCDSSSSALRINDAPAWADAPALAVRGEREHVNSAMF